MSLRHSVLAAPLAGAAAALALLTTAAAPAAAGLPIERTVEDTDDDVLISSGGTQDDVDFYVYQRTDLDFVYAGPGENKRELLLQWRTDTSNEYDSADYQRVAQLRAVDTPTAKQKKKGVKAKAYQVRLTYTARAAEPFTVEQDTAEGWMAVSCSPAAEDAGLDFFVYLPKKCLPRGVDKVSATFRTVTQDGETGWTLSDMAQLRDIRV